MRILRYLILTAIAAVLVIIGVANRAPVLVHALPPEAGDFLGLSWSLQLPLFLVIFAAMLVGLLLGFVWEWARERRHRADRGNGDRGGPRGRGGLRGRGGPARPIRRR